MRAVIQRVARASVEVEGRIVGCLDEPGGLVVLAGLSESDGEGEIAWMADKVVNLRVFADAEGKMNRSVIDTDLGLLLVPNFTLAGDASKGRRPSFDHAMKPPEAQSLFERFVGLVRAAGPRVETGVFRAQMLVSIVNDGPITLVLDSPVAKAQ
jgi:D-tyrosyl-tRNA(Tyr) deacylase